MKKGLLIVLSGPSGTGKGTVCKALIGEVPNMEISVSCTTRNPRDGETDGKDYYYKSQDEFIQMIQNGEFLEHAQVFDHFYGTPYKHVKKKLDKGIDVLLEIDIQGAEQVREKYAEAVLIFLVPPSMDELKARIMSRGSETEEQMKKRFAKAYSELERIHQYEYVIINDDIDEVVRKIRCIIQAEKLKVKRNLDMEKKLLKGEKIV